MLNKNKVKNKINLKRRKDLNVSINYEQNQLRKRQNQIS